MSGQSLKEFENGLQTKIKNSESPFLGLFENHIDHQIRHKLVAFIQDSPNPFEKFIKLLDTYPAAFSTLIVIQLLEDFGENGYFEVYPVLEKIFGHDLTQRQKEILWREFRLACLLDLGISISPRRSGPHFMVREYLRQVGLPLRYVDQFTKTALRYVNQTGIPDLDDPELLKIWQEGLVTRLRPKVVKEAIQRDDICYHSQLFIGSLFGGDNDLAGLSRIESGMKNAIASEPQVRRSKKAGIPRIIFRDFDCGVLLPGSQNPVNWNIQENDYSPRTYISRNDDQFVPFDTALPLKTVITNDEGFSCSYPLWEDEKNNRILIFSLPDGKFLAGACLADAEVFLDPGSYLILTRFLPNDQSEIEIHSESPEIYTHQATLAPGEIYALQRGPAKIEIKAEEKPLLYFQQDSLRGARGNELYPGEGLKLEIIIPKEMVGTNKKFRIKMNSKSLGDPIELPFPEQEDNHFILNIGKVMAKFWRPGVSKVLFEVFREDLNRSIVGKSAALWNGLLHIKNRSRFLCSKLPDNLIEDSCENLEREPQTSSITFRDETNRFFKMAFEDGPRILFFTWSVPGIFLSLKDYAKQNQEEKGLRIGETVSITGSSRKVLTVFASEPALLKLGNWEQKVDFSRLGSKKIQLSGMVEYLAPGQDALLLINENTAAPIKLLRFISPFEIKSYRVESGLGLRKIELSIYSPIQALRLLMKNLATGDMVETSIPLEEVGQTVRFEIVSDIYATIFQGTPNECIVNFPETNWPSGLWLISIMVKAENRWGALTDSKGAIYKDGFISKPSQVGINFDEVWWWFSENYRQDEYSQIFGRIDGALQASYALGCWSQISWLENFWIKLGKELAKEPTVEDCLKLLSLTGKRNSFIDDGYAIPYFHPGTAVSSIFCLDKCRYPDKRMSESSFHSCLKFLPKLKDPCQAFSCGYFDFAALFGFSNALEVAQTKCTPKCFTMQSYIDSLKARDLPEKWRLLHDDQWLPAKGDILGPMHYRFAFFKFRDEFANAMASDSKRLAGALSLPRQMYNFSMPVLVDDRLIRRAETGRAPGLLINSLQPNEELLDDEAAVTVENQVKIHRFISLFAQVCRWEQREQGTMEVFFNKACEICNLPQAGLRKHLGYLLYLAEDLFGFYLLLWELIFSADCDLPRRRYV